MIRRHRRAAFLAIRKVITMNIETKCQTKPEKALAEMREAARRFARGQIEDFGESRKIRGIRERLRAQRSLPACHGQGHAGAV